MQRAEAVKYDLKNVAGKIDRVSGKFVHSMWVDEEYTMMAGHVEISLREKIQEGAYVDFAKLIPKDRVTEEGDQRMEMVNHNGLSYGQRSRHYRYS